MNLQFHQTATYWGAPIASGFGGYIFAPPIEVQVRWEDKNEEFIDDQGRVRVSQAAVFSETDMETGGFLFLGSSSEADPSAVDGALPIQKYAKTPDLRAVRYLRKAWL